MTCSCSGLTEIREVLPRKSINTQTRFWESISSTVAMNSANGPLKSLTASPLLHFYAATACLRRRSAAWALRQEAVKVPWVAVKTDQSWHPHRSIYLAPRGTLPLECHKHVTRKQRAQVLHELYGLRCVTSRIGKTVSKPWRWRLRRAARCEFALYSRKNQSLKLI